jgi:DNA-binding MarR family transcriptional regulator
MDEKLSNDFIDEVLFRKTYVRQFDYLKKIKELFSSVEEYMVLHCIASHNSKDLILEIKSSGLIVDADLYIKNYWDSLINKKNSGVSIHGISRDTEIPRTTVKRWTNSLIQRGLIIKNLDGYLVPTGLIREYCKDLIELVSKEHIDFANFYSSLKI